MIELNYILIKLIGADCLVIQTHQINWALLSEKIRILIIRIMTQMKDPFFI